MSNATLEITTKIGCLNNCRYCPQNKILNAYNGKRILSFEDFKKALNTVPKEIIITFSGFTEPFLNNNCDKMIKYAYEQGYRISLFTLEPH